MVPNWVTLSPNGTNLGKFQYILTLHLTYLIVISSADSSFLNFKKGDLIILDQANGETVMNSGWCYGQNVNSNKKGDFPAECVYVLPTITKPPPEILVCLNIYTVLFIMHVSSAGVAVS